MKLGKVCDVLERIPSRSGVCSTRRLQDRGLARPGICAGSQGMPKDLGVSTEKHNGLEGARKGRGKKCGLESDFKDDCPAFRSVFLA